MTRPSLSRRLSGAWPAANSLQSHIRAEQVRIVFRQAPPAQLLSLVAAGAVCWALWDVTPHASLLTWVGVVATMTLGRLGLAAVFTRRQPGPEAMVAWERAFVGSLAAVTLAWGVGAWLVMPPDSPVHQAVVYFILMGVAGGAVATCSAPTS